MRDEKSELEAGESSTKGNPSRRRPRILLVEDDARLGRSFVEATAGDYEVRFVQSGEEGLELLNVEAYDCIVLDLYLKPGNMNGLEFLDRALRDRPWAPVMIMTVEEKAEPVLAAMQRGACGYAPKSLPFEEITQRMESCLERHRLIQKAGELERVQRSDRPLVILDHPAMSGVYRDIKRAAEIRATVLLEGETGTGKSVAAREIHALSDRRDSPFIVYDCGASKGSLMESELFGTLKGAFTDAGNRAGMVEAAHGGTLFLDELDKLDDQAQGKLLQLVEERSIRRIGSTKQTSVDVRIIGASSKNLRVEVERGRFKLELLGRFEVFKIRMPPLRKMKSVIPELATMKLRRFADEMHRPIECIDDQAMDLLVRWPWPGNIRELRNTMEYAAIHCDETEIHPYHLPEQFRASESRRPRGLAEAAQAAAEDTRRRMIVEALHRNDWNVQKAARELSITPQGLRQHMSRLGISAKRGSSS